MPLGTRNRETFALMLTSVLKVAPSAKKESTVKMCLGASIALVSGRAGYVLDF